MTTVSARTYRQGCEPKTENAFSGRCFRQFLPTETDHFWFGFPVAKNCLKLETDSTFFGRFVNSVFPTPITPTCWYGNDEKPTNTSAKTRTDEAIFLVGAQP